MAKLVFACERGGKSNRVTGEHLHAVASRLCPDNIIWPPAAVKAERGVVAAVMGGVPGDGLRDNAVWVGQIEEEILAESHSGLVDFEGAYAICRWSDTVVEAATDAVASRTLWYCHTDDLFLVSTSQRAIVALLGDFQMNHSVIPWMLSSGSLGPQDGWDFRVHRLGPDSILTLDRIHWKLSHNERPVIFKPVQKNVNAHKHDLQAALEKSCAPLSKLVDRGWRLPLSGGVDSRALLLMMTRAGTKPQCLTWGRKAALHEPGNDAYIARQLAEQVKTPHEYAPLDVSSMDTERVIERFLKAGEARVDHISGYMDGFEIWRRLFESGVPGVIRGDETFGWKAVASERQARFELGLMLLTDYFEAGQLSSWGLEAPNLPGVLSRHSGETLPEWRDRLYQQFRLPVILAALNDLKCGYVEIVNPLLSRSIVEVVRRMPDDLRTEKRLFQQLIMALSPPVPLARNPAIESPKGIMAGAAFRSWMQQQLRMPEAACLPGQFREKLLTKISSGAKPAESSGTSIRSIAKRLLSPGMAAQLKKFLPARRPVLDWNVLAFRACLIIGATRMFTEDAASLRSADSHSEAPRK